jgi:uncharacterized membrane protein
MPDVIERETHTVSTAPVVVEDRGGGGGMALAIILGLLIVGAILFFAVFGGARYFGSTSNTPVIVQPSQPKASDVNVQVNPPAQNPPAQRAPTQNPPAQPSDTNGYPPS